MIEMRRVSVGKGMLADAVVGGPMAAVAISERKVCFVRRDHVELNEKCRCFDPSAEISHPSAQSSRPRVYPKDQEGPILARIPDSPALC